MRGASIRLKITLWFSAALILVAAITYGVIFAISRQVILKNIRDSLIETMAHNVDEVEYYADLHHVDLTSTLDHYLRYGEGYLEVDDDFLDEVNGVFTALYQEDGTFLYGENPIARETQDLPFQNEVIQEVTAGDVLYYVYDCALPQAGLSGLWLRGAVAETQGKVQLTNIAQMSLILMPLLVLAAIVGGYLIAGRMLRPIKKITAAAAEIRAGGDLNKRIELGKGGDELHQLAGQFNAMFARLDEAFQTERQFTSDASHELRTPMSVILAQCELALEEDGTTEEYREALQVIARQGKKMARLIQDMLDFSRLELQSERYTRERVDLSALLETQCPDLALIREQGITLTWDAAPGIAVMGNRELLTRLLTNLVSNAYRYGRPDGHIQVSLTETGSEAVLTVADDGIGIAQEEQEKIFRRFYQADSSRTGQGSGLGLSMVQEIARFHGGGVSLTSEVGNGSTFTVLIKKSAD